MGSVWEDRITHGSGQAILEHDKDSTRASGMNCTVPSKPTHVGPGHILPSSLAAGTQRPWPCPLAEGRPVSEAGHGWTSVTLPGDLLPLPLEGSEDQGVLDVPPPRWLHAKRPTLGPWVTWPFWWDPYQPLPDVFYCTEYLGVALFSFLGQVSDHDDCGYHQVRGHRSVFLPRPLQPRACMS